jgi:hypothetical protein
MASIVEIATRRFICNSKLVYAFDHRRYFFKLNTLIFVTNTFISHPNKQTVHTKYEVIMHNSGAMLFPKNLIPWRGFEPGSTVPEADAMFTAPSRTREVE